MASAADLRDILSLDSSSKTSKTTAPKKLNVAPRREPGISRELYSLIGNSAPTLVAQYAHPKLKQKPDLGRPRSKWEWKSFENGARTDNLRLSHWVKVGPGPDNGDAYPFAKFNENPNIVYDYSMDEYMHFLEDSDWTREETDYLFSLVKEFDVRFYVVADRYDFPGGRPRTIQELKARYYSICRRLIKNRPFAGDEATRNTVISSYSFDKERETLRKNYLDAMFKRSPEQIAEEEALYIECKRIEQNERRFQKERDNLLRVVAGIDSGLSTLRIDDPANLIDPKRKKKRLENGAEMDSPVTGTPTNLIALPSPYGGSSGLPSSRPKSNSVSSTSSNPRIISMGSVQGASIPIPPPTVDPINCLTQLHPSALPLNAKSAHKPVYLRSTMYPQPKSNLLQKINQIVTEQGIHPSKLVMPTQGNIAKVEELQSAAIGLLEMKKGLDRVEHEIRILKATLRGGSAEDAEGELMAEDAAEDQDQGAADKRQNRRSASIASSVASNQRPNVKRQRRE